MEAGAAVEVAFTCGGDVFTSINTKTTTKKVILEPDLEKTVVDVTNK